MKKLNIVVFILLITASQFIFGQQDNSKTEEAFLQQIESSAVYFPLQNGLDFSNMAQIQQMGNNNDASINQTLTGTNVPGNVAELIQNGNVNDALLIQTGNGNNHLIHQSGNKNTFEASVIGDNNSSIVDQFGNHNMINQNLVGNNMAFILGQNGNNNEINQIENDQVPRQYQIYQTGNAMSITIINGGL
ncbi:MAG: hypothetical protein WAV89_05035 [Ignavibacteriaceae bacterium]